MSLQYLLGVRAVNFDNFIYDTYSISAIRGGSYVLRDVIRGLKDELDRTVGNGVRVREVSARASNGLFVVEGTDKGRMEALVDKLFRRLKALTDGHATFVADFVEWQKDSDFKKARKELDARLNRQQYHHTTVVPPKHEPNAKSACEHDGVRPGVVLDPQGQLMSESVRYRMDRGRSLRQKIYAKLLGVHVMNSLEFTDDLEELASASSEQILDNKMALIYVDGNRFGRINQSCVSPDELEELDSSIDGSQMQFLKSLIELASSNPDFQTDKGRIRCELLLWGGDEIELIVPAWKGWQVLKLFFDQTKNACFSGSIGQFELTNSAGIVFCHHNAPILQVRGIAKALVKHAKQVVPREPKNCTHAQHDSARYFVLESFDMLGRDLDEILIMYYKDEAVLSKLRLEAKHLEQLLNDMVEIKKVFPHGKVYEIIRTVSSGQQRLVAGLVDRALSEFPEDQQIATKERINRVIQGDIERWYMIAELWDYIQ